MIKIVFQKNFPENKKYMFENYTAEKFFSLTNFVKKYIKKLIDLQ